MPVAELKTSSMLHRSRSCSNLVEVASVRSAPIMRAETKRKPKPDAPSQAAPEVVAAKALKEVPRVLSVKAQAIDKAPGSEPLDKYELFVAQVGALPYVGKPMATSIRLAAACIKGALLAVIPCFLFEITSVAVAASFAAVTVSYFIGQDGARYLPKIWARPVLENAASGANKDADFGTTKSAGTQAKAQPGFMRETFSQAWPGVLLGAGAFSVGVISPVAAAMGLAASFGCRQGEKQRIEEKAVRKGTIMIQSKSLVDVPEDLERWVKTIANNDRLQKIYPGSHVSNHALLYGPTGTGKTAGLKLLCTMNNYIFHDVNATDINNMYVGESEKRVAQAFERARAHARETERPVIVFFDEIDTIFTNRKGGEIGARHHHGSVLGEFLKQIDGTKSYNENLFVVGGTNRPEALDTALKSRFSAQIQFNLPDTEKRAHFIRQRLQDYRHSLSFAEQVELVVATESMSYREIERTVLMGAALRVVYDDRETVTMADMRHCIDEWKKAFKEDEANKKSTMVDLEELFKQKKILAA